MNGDAKDSGNLIRLLLVEDSPDNQLLVQAFLKKIDCRIDVASDGREGVDKALAGTYDLILMDMQMPVLDGFGATRELRDAGYTGPIIALTAHAMDEEKNRIMEAGCSGHLTKPISRQTLIDTVRQYATSG